MRVLFSIGLVFSAVSSFSAAAQNTEATDIIRGRVVTRDSQPIVRAIVSVRPTDGGAARETRTDQRGSYTVLYPGSAGDYTITIRSVGMRQVILRAVRLREGMVITGNATLTEAPDSIGATKLTNVDVNAKRPRIPAVRSEGSPGESQKFLSASTPGEPQRSSWDQLDPGQYSVLGTSPSENTLSVNGTVVQTVLPTVPGFMSATTADPSRGGFSGGNINVNYAAGGGYHLRELTLRLAPSGLQSVDRASALVGNRKTDWSASFSMFDPFFDQAIRERTDFTIEQRISSLPQFPRTSDGLARLGISSDSLRRFFDVVQQAGIPVTLSSLPSSQRATRYAWMSRFDIGQSPIETFNVMMNVGVSTTEGIGTGPTSLTSHGGKSHQSGGFITAAFSRYLGNGFLTDFSATLNPFSYTSSPYLTLPEGRVRVASDLGTTGTGEPTVTWLMFGGNPNIGAASRGFNGELRGSSSWYSYNGKHKLSLGGSARVERLSSNPILNPLGTFEFQSLSAFAAGDASRFTRQSVGPSSRASSVHVDASLGDTWDVIPALTVLYGMRIDRDQVFAPIAYNPAVDSLFGQRTNALPRTFLISPRLGLSYQYSESKVEPNNIRFPGIISLIFGRYQSSLNASTAAMLSQFTGLPSGVRVLDCVGDQVPSVDWMGYRNDPSSVPNQCIDGSGSQPVSEVAPTVQLLNPSYRPPSQWRANVSLNNSTWVAFNAELTISRGTTQTSALDLNLRSTPQFTLLGENGRPVYVPVDAIVPSTGFASLQSSRISSRFGQVLSTMSDLHSQFTQLSISKTFGKPGALNNIIVQYLGQWGRQQQRGFQGGIIAGNPFTPTWGPSGAPHHGFSLSFQILHQRIVTVSGYGWLRSGSSYTPVVAGDINGDGMVNDAAYISNPNTVSTADLRDGMRALLQSAPTLARRCLSSQMGRIAARNSCVGPWSGGLDLGMRITLPQLKTQSIEIRITNAAGALDRMLHGSEHVRGWGEVNFVDQTLLIPYGFDPTTREYRYQVNPRFGKRSPWRTPTEIQFRISTPLGPSGTTQSARWQAKQARESKKSPEAMNRLAIAKNYFPLLSAFQDTLKFTPEQMASIQAISENFNKATDSVQAELSKYIENVSDTVSDEVLASHVMSVYAELDTISIKSGRQVFEVLTQKQRDGLPFRLQAWLTGELRALPPKGKGTPFNM